MAGSVAREIESLLQHAFVPTRLDVINDSVGAVDDDLTVAIGLALSRDRDTCRAYAQGFSWARCTDQFLSALIPARRGERLAT